MTRHGRVARTPVSPRDPALLTIVLPEQRSTTRSSERATAHRDELASLAESLQREPTVRNLWRQQLSLTRIFDWLDGFPADTWQNRWLLSGSDDLGSGWGPQGLSAGTRSRFTAGLGTLIVLQVIRPSYGWLFGSRLLGVYDAYRRHNQPALFAELKQRAGGQRCDEHATEALNVLTRMSIVTGKDLMTFDLEDLTDYARAHRDNGRTVTALPLAYDILHAVGGLKDSPPTLREAQARGQLTPAELIDRHPIANRAVRDVLVHYLAERSAVLDYGSLVNHAQMLAVFWGDLQRHHPTIFSLNLTDEVAQAWKQRVRVLPDGRPRRTAYALFLAVRSFYLDLSQWSMEDPARWAAWAAPCPISEADIRGYIKETRHRQARMQQRTRTLAPVLPQLVRAAEARLQRATLLLQAAHSAEPGEEFTVEGSQYRHRQGRQPLASHRAVPRPRR
ncbi:hypothetical protein [Streptomyces sp. NBC_01089]|uniref:hypothetical protein n=1 Tax=Streptomyces sp. NBC_01089 TaxID=2903747 RepID=UPI00386EFCAD|nr:hypothetical protein OG510_12395 [Streptomyces sp. NBC_01089]